LQQKYVYLPTTPVYFADTVPCENYDLLISVVLPVCCVFKKWPLYCVQLQQICQAPSNLTIFSRYMPQEFCNETFISLSSLNLALHVATAHCKASNNLRACQTQSLIKVIKQ